MKAYWTRLNARERRVVILGVIALLVLGFYFVIYEPITRFLDEQVTLWKENEDTLDWMQKVRKQYNPAQLRQDEQSAGQPLLSIFSKALKQTPLSAFQYQFAQVEPKKIQLKFEKVPYVLFLNWLKQLSSRNSFQIQSFEVERTETSGVVKLNLIVSG